MASRLSILWILILFFATFSFAQNPPKVIALQNTASTLLVKFDQNVDKDSFKFLHLNIDGIRKNIYDLNGILTTKPLEITMEDGIEGKIAQFDKETIRIVFSSKGRFYSASKNISKDTIEFKITAGISTNTNLVQATQTTKPKSTEPKKEIPKKEVFTPTTPTHIPKNKTIVLDAGHGGKDCGAYGINKVCEKVIVFDITKKVSSDLKKMGYKVLLTRNKDIFITLRNRTKFANDNNADAFVSIHANAVPKGGNKEQSGIETYFLSTARSDRAKNVAALENRDELENMDYFAKETTLGILNNQRMVASNKLALDIQYDMLKSVRTKYKTNDGGVREGPFWVLLGAQMPSILIEVGYLTNAEESRKLVNADYQKIVARGIAEGIDSYFRKNSN